MQVNAQILPCFSTTLFSYFTGLGGWYSYRMSKAALNMATRNLSIELGRSRRKVKAPTVAFYFLSVKACWPLWPLSHVIYFFTGGVCVLTSRNSKHWPVPALSQECAKRKVVQHWILGVLSDEHHRYTEYGEDWEGVQLGRDRTSVVESTNWQWNESSSPSLLPLFTASSDVYSTLLTLAIDYLVYSLDVILHSVIILKEYKCIFNCWKLAHKVKWCAYQVNGADVEWQV